MRNAFIEELLIAAEAHENIVLVVGDLGFSVVEPFALRFPKRFYNAGVAEQNMMGLCAGLASEGFHVFAYSIANFPTFRCAEQIRNDVAYHNLPVTIVAVGGGLAYGNMGYSHHAVQDYALMRVMPNMLIAAPGDPMETRACFRYLVDRPQPSYLRLGKAGEPCIHTEIPQIAEGEWLRVIEGKSVGDTLLSTGSALFLARQLISRMPEYAHYALHSIPLWSMKAKQAQVQNVSGWNQVVTAEDHLIDAGFGSWMLESLAKHRDLLPRVRIHGLDSIVCGMVGKQEALNVAGGFPPTLSRKAI